MYANVGGQWVPTNGFSSGSGVRGQVGTYKDCVSYLGLGDFVQITNNNQAVALSFNGVPYTTNNVINGSYAFWGYEHLCSRMGLSGNQVLLRNALESAITNSTYQHTSPVYTGQFVATSDMQVQRSSDGGIISGVNF